MRVPFLLRRTASLYPKLYPIGSADKRLAINFTRLLREVSMAGLKQRGAIWYLTYYVNNKKRAVSLETESLQTAKEKKRQFESAQARGDGTSLPTRTPIADVVAGYVQHIRTIK